MEEHLNDTLVSNYVSPYNEAHKDIYTYAEWTQDVCIAAEKYYTSISYKSETINEVIAEPWMLCILLFGFASIAFIRSAYRKRFTMLFQTIVNWKLSKQIIRYEKVYTHPVNILLSLNFILCIPLFYGITMSTEFKIGDTIEMSFLIVLIPLLIYFTLKLILYKFSGWLFKEKEAVEEYIFQANLFNKYLGVAFLILTTLLIYSLIPSHILYKIGLATLILFLMFQVVRGVIIGIQRGTNLFFIILYLCTLEILPWLVLGKWIQNTL